MDLSIKYWQDDGKPLKASPYLATEVPLFLIRNETSKCFCPFSLLVGKRQKYGPAIIIDLCCIPKPALEVVEWRNILCAKRICGITCGVFLRIGHTHKHKNNPARHRSQKPDHSKALLANPSSSGDLARHECPRLLKHAP